MSYPLEPIDLLIDVSKVLYNERIVEQRKIIEEQKKEIEKLKSIGFYGIYMHSSVNNKSTLLIYHFIANDDNTIESEFKINLEINMKNDNSDIDYIDIEFDMIFNAEHLYNVVVHYLLGYPLQKYQISYKKLN
jgi:hypothetical protein